MSVDVVILVLTAVLAVVAVAAAVICVRAVRELRAQPPRPTTEPVTQDVAVPEPQVEVTRPVEVVQGRVVALMSADDLQRARLDRPTVRLRTYAHGLAHALRPESRDRITALMRREYRRRRAVRVKAARRAMWTSVPNRPAPSVPQKAVNR